MKVRKDLEGAERNIYTGVNTGDERREIVIGERRVEGGQNWQIATVVIPKTSEMMEIRRYMSEQVMREVK